jgi:hypothetical protein
LRLSRDERQIPALEGSNADITRESASMTDSSDGDKGGKEKN